MGPCDQGGPEPHINAHLHSPVYQPHSPRDTSMHKTNLDRRTACLYTCSLITYTYITYTETHPNLHMLYILRHIPPISTNHTHTHIDTPKVPNLDNDSQPHKAINNQTCYLLLDKYMNTLNTPWHVLCLHLYISVMLYTNTNASHT
jgi:hypothetical protein